MARKKPETTGYNPMEVDVMDVFPEPQKNLAGKLAEIGLVVGYVQKDKQNTGQGYSYASAEAVLKKVNSECFSRGIAIQSNAEIVSYNEYGPEGKKKMRAVVKLTLQFIDSAEGSTRAIQVEGLGEGMDAGDKAVLKANTSALKYALANAFLISWGDDPEADASTDADSKPQRSPKATNDGTSVSQAIASATLSNINDVRGQVLQLRGTPEYPALVEKIKAKQAELGWTAS
jgi:hypothetical protein